MCDLVRKASKGKLVKVQSILQQKRVKLPDASKAFVHASYGGHLEVVKFLNQMFDLTTVYDEALCGACFSDHRLVVDILLQWGANPSCQDNLPLVFACQGGHLDLVKYLVSLGANPIPVLTLCRTVATTFKRYSVLEYLSSVQTL